jgi:hypothetical protein
MVASIWRLLGIAILLCSSTALAKKVPSPEDEARERAVQEALDGIDKDVVKEEARRLAVERAQRLSYAYASGAGDPIFSLLRPMLAVGFETRQGCEAEACLPLVTVRFGAEIALSLWFLDLFGRGGGGVDYRPAQGTRWYGWGQAGLRHNLIGVIPVELFLDVASSPYERVMGMGMGIESGNKVEWGAGLSVGAKLGGSALSVFVRLAAPDLVPVVADPRRHFSALVGVQMIAPPIRGIGSR